MMVISESCEVDLLLDIGRNRSDRTGRSVVPEPHSKSKWNQKRRALIEDKINVTQFVIELQVDNEVTKEVVVA